jgi:hypothetical protein
MTIRPLILAILLYACGSFQNAQALLITSNLSYISGNTWQYNYTVTNDSSSFNIEWFAIYFDDLNYDNLVLVDGPSAEWDIIVEQPGAVFPGEDGYIDLFALAPSLALGFGESIFNLIVSFNYEGSGTPLGEQFVDVYDTNIADPFSNPLESGTTPAITGQLPVTHASGLFILGIIAVMSRSVLRRRTK